MTCEKCRGSGLLVDPFSSQVLPCTESVHFVRYPESPPGGTMKVYTVGEDGTVTEEAPSPPVAFDCDRSPLRAGDAIRGAANPEMRATVVDEKIAELTANGGLIQSVLKIGERFVYAPAYWKKCDGSEEKPKLSPASFDGVEFPAGPVKLLGPRR